MASSPTKYEFLDPPVHADDLGKLGAYRVIDELGKGGMGFVFRAEDTKLKRTVALKVMNKKVAATPHAKKRFISEARAMAAVHHDNVAMIFEVGEHSGTPFMAMEMLKGGTLEDYKKGSGEQPSFEKIIRVAKEMAQGLAAAHEKGIVHRDIKPANIWVEESSERIKILDFGLALAQSPVDRLAGRGSVIGTPGYLSPEQARSEPLDDRSDLYSLGVVLYELATGKLPLQSKTVAGQLIAILAHTPQPIREINQSIPTPLADLIQRLLRKEPRNRIRSAAELVAELERVEKECESKSEVALAINKLQAGLQEVVSKKQAPEPTVPQLNLPAATSQPLGADPFANLPNAPAVAAPAAGLSSPSLPAVPANAGRPATKAKSQLKKSNPGKKKAQPKQSTSPMVLYGGAAAVGLAIVGVIAYIMVPVDNERQTVVISDPDPTTNSNVPPVTNTNANSSTNTNNQPPSSGTQSASPKTDWSQNNQTIPVLAKQISNVYVPGAKTLMNANTANGSFERTKQKKQPNPKLAGSGGSKQRIPAWGSTRKQPGKSGWKNDQPNGASDGKFFAFTTNNGVLELVSDSLQHKVQEGDVVRVTADIGGINTGGQQGNAVYTYMVGFRAEGAKTGVKYKLGEFSDNTDAKQGLRTIGYEFTVPFEETNKRPFIRFIIKQTDQRRSESFLDNVQVTVTPKGADAPTIDPPNSNDMASNTSSKPPELAPIVPMEEPEPEPNPDPEPEPKSLGEMVVLNVEDGVGADSTVKKNASARDTQGKKKNLVVQSRNGIELQHTYVRFDLSAIDGGNQNGQNNGGGRNKKNNNKTRNTGMVALVLTSPDQSAKGATLRVYGTDNPNSGRWQEEGPLAISWKKSFSETGIDELPKLAEVRIEKIEGNVIRIESPELAEFIRGAGAKSVTLIVTGGKGNSPVQFASREAGSESAPQLIVEKLN